MNKIEDLTGKKYGRWTVFNRAENNKRGDAMWLCRCECGHIATVKGFNLKRGFSLSCGCWMKENMKRLTTERNITHGQTHTPLYHVWGMIIQRCCNPNNKRFKDYGGRGITCCSEWRNNFLSFQTWAVSNGYKEGLTIERINNDKGYQPDNCKWITRAEQNRNKRNSLMINGKCLAVFCRKNGLNYSTINARINGKGMPIERAVK